MVQYSPNETIALDILRNGAPMTVQVTLGTRPGNP
jgi:S1-C subfamily serine protease